MHYRKPHKSILKRLCSGSWWALFTMFIWELVEEGLESFIAFCISEVVAMFVVKALSTLAIIGATQGIKVCIKRFLVPMVKTLTYKEGHDKMSKVKEFFKWLFANKKSLIGTIVGAVGAGAGITASWKISSLPIIAIKGYNIAPIVYTVICIFAFILNELGICGKGFEKVADYLARTDLIKAQKEEKAILKEAKKELLDEEKRASQTKSDQEKEAEKAKADAEAKEKLEKATAERRAKIDEAKAKLLAEKNQSK